MPTAVNYAISYVCYQNALSVKNPFLFCLYEWTGNASDVLHSLVWEATQYMIRELLDGAGNQGAANLRSQLGTIKKAARHISLSAV